MRLPRHFWCLPEIYLQAYGVNLGFAEVALDQLSVYDEYTTETLAKQQE